MTRYIGALCAVLLIQLGLVLTVYWPSLEPESGSAASPLLAFDPSVIDELYVSDSEGNEAVLLRLANQWILPDLGGAAVDTTMIDTLLEGLAAGNNSWPIATSTASRQRFQVAAYHFQRRLTLISEGELLGTIYLGTSPGFRKAHARNDAQDAIYSIALNNYDAPAIVDKWLDKTLLQVAEPTAISSEDYALVKVDNEWINALGGLPEPRELAALLLSVRGLQIEGTASEEMRDALDIAAPDLTLMLETPDKKLSLSLLTLADQRFIKSSNNPYYFRLSDYDYDRLTQIDVAQLTRPPTAPTPSDTLESDTLPEE